MKYYLKKCGFQELGSVGVDGIVHRGRYLLTSMNEEVLAMFPPLSVAQLNDSALLPIMPLYSGEKVYCNFVYHNDKYHGSTATHPRNEYRIYLNKALEQNRNLFCADDIMVIRTEEITDEDNQVQIVYLMDLVKDRTSAEYAQLNSAIDNYPIRGGYGIFDGILPFFEKKVERLKQSQDSTVVIDNSVTQRIISAQPDSLASLFNAATFRDFVMVGYDNLCAITGTVIRYESYMNLEAAHIRPKSHGGTFLPNNGIALCRDLHWAFDKGFFTLNDNYEVQVHPKVTSEYLRSFDGKKIRIPSNPFFVPDIESIRYHRNSVYGLFLTTGRL